MSWARGETLVLTAAAILAVEFTHFPSRLEKCAWSGVSLMDAGGGLIVLVTSGTAAAARPIPPAQSGKSPAERFSELFVAQSVVDIM